jgi:hypothetical protein
LGRKPLLTEPITAVNESEHEFVLQTELTTDDTVDGFNALTVVVTAGTGTGRIAQTTVFVASDSAIIKSTNPYRPVSIHLPEKIDLDLKQLAPVLHNDVVPRKPARSGKKRRQTPTLRFLPMTDEKQRVEQSHRALVKDIARKVTVLSKTRAIVKARKIRRLP